MAKYLAGVLTVIAVGVLLVAYGLLNPRVGSIGVGYAQPGFPMDVAAQRGVATPYGELPQYVAYAPTASTYPAVRAVPASQTFAEAPVRPAPRRAIARAPKRDWVRTAMIIGGSSAAGAGVGGLIAGKKGALIGAAIGGGAGTLLQAAR